ncbi:MAG: DUF3307 domain-containing protein [Chloroflexota bacterium]
MVNLPEALALLLLTHVIGDYALQTDSIYKLKTTGGIIGLAIHVAIHIIITGMLLQLGFLRNWLLLLLLFLLHFTVDLAKLQMNTRFQFVAYLLDQVFHIFCILFLFWLFPQTETLVPSEYLFYLLMYSLVPFVTMTMWVWYSEKQRLLRPDDEAILTKGFFGRMKRVSQISALPLIIAVALWLQFDGITLLEMVITTIETFS